MKPTTRKKPEPPKINNYLLKFKEVLVIDANGVKLGILKSRDAIFKAREAELDLVLINETAEPPVAKIVDYGKYKYLQSKTVKKDKPPETKTVQVSPNIGDNDLQRFAKRAEEFVNEGHSVLISCFLRKKELQSSALIAIGKSKMQFIIDYFPNQLVNEIKLNGNKITCLIKKLK